MTSFRITKSILTVTLLLVILAFAGCSDDESSPIVEPEVTPVQSPTADALMQNFEAFTSGMLIDEFGDILHDDFQLVFLAGTVEDWGLAPGSTLNREQMLHIHGNMFGGIAGSDMHENNIAPLDRIEVSLFERVGQWTDAAIDDPLFAGTQQALFTVRIFFHDNTGGHAFEVNQTLLFYAEQVGDYWYLKGIRPMENKSVERSSYDSVIYLYNSLPVKPRD